MMRFVLFSMLFLSACGYETLTNDKAAAQASRAIGDSEVSPLRCIRTGGSAGDHNTTWTCTDTNKRVFTCSAELALVEDSGCKPPQREVITGCIEWSPRQ